VGRTNATFRNLLQGIRERWRDYRRGLRARDQPHFDRLFEHADAHADAASYRNPEDPMDAVLLSMLLEHEKRLAALEDGMAADAGDGSPTGVDTDEPSAGVDPADEPSTDVDPADEPSTTGDVDAGPPANCDVDDGLPATGDADDGLPTNGDADAESPATGDAGAGAERAGTD
jgi:hypothetical protein